jgi:hypothetical protein
MVIEGVDAIQVDSIVSTICGGLRWHRNLVWVGRSRSEASTTGQ